jgi:DNA primase
LISPVTIEAVKERMDIEEVVSDYVSLKKKGKDFWACCPFHDEKTPSFSVAPVKGIYKCFGCGKAGDSITFIMEHEKFSYTEAIRHLAGKYGIEIAEDEQATEEQQQEKNERESLFIILKFAKEHYHENLKTNDEGRSVGLTYLKERGYNDATINKFELGYAVDQWEHFSSHALKNQFNKEILENAGLIIKKDDGGFYDRFRGRVMFPIHDISGRIVAFGGRTLRKDKKTPKYINSPETVVYHKSKVLYGMYQAKQAIRDQENCYLVEGYTDVISLHLSGVENVVSSSGTSLTEDQIKLISRFTKNITVLFDGDTAGIKASLRGIDMILASGLNVRVVLFPDGEDPDSYSQKMGTEAFAQFLKDNVKDFIHFKTSLYAEEAKADPVKRAESAREIIRSIAIIPDNVQRAIYLKEASDLLKLEESVLVAEMNKILIQERRKKKVKSEDQPAGDTDIKDFAKKPQLTNHTSIISLQERENLSLLINFGHVKFEDGTFLYEYVKQEQDELEFMNQDYKEIYDLYFKAVENGMVPQGNYFLQHGDEKIKQVIADLISERYEISQEWENKYQILVPKKEENLDIHAFTNIYRLKLRIIHKLLDENKEKLKNPKDDDEETQLLNIHVALKRSEMEIAKHLGIVVARG